MSDKERGDNLRSATTSEPSPGGRRSPNTTHNVLVTIAVLFLVSVGFLLAALTVSPLVASRATTLEVYEFLVRLSALWAGITWLSASIYLSFITAAKEFSTEIWLAFLVGALMSYIGVGGPFTAVAYWLGVRTMMYGLMSLVPIALVINVQSQLGDERPPITLIQLLFDGIEKLIARLKK